MEVKESIGKGSGRRKVTEKGGENPFLQVASHRAKCKDMNVQVGGIKRTLDSCSEAEFLNFIAKPDAIFTVNSGRLQQTRQHHHRPTPPLIPAKTRFSDTVKMRLIKLQLHQNIIFGKSIKPEDH